MATVSLGVFSSRDRAEAAINALEVAGYAPQDISIVMKDIEEGKDLANSTGANMAEGAVSGATTGGIIGGIAGLLIGIGAITIPGVGALLIAGPLAAALGLTGTAATTAAGAMTGALAGGLVGGLSGLGISAADAKRYEDRVKEGAILVAVPDLASGSSSEDILTQQGAEDVQVITTDRF